MNTATFFQFIMKVAKICESANFEKDNSKEIFKQLNDLIKEYEVKL